MKKNLISVNDLSLDDIHEILDLAKKIKKDPKAYREVMQGRKLGLIFEKPSTRTWISFEVGVFSLGGGTIYFGPEDMKLGQREEVRDVARVLSRYLAGMVLRTFKHKTILEFTQYFEKPVINGLSDTEHPCQALSDYFTITESFGDVKKPVISFVGDGNNVLNSLILLSARLGGKFRYATPKKHAPNPEVLKQAQAYARKSGAVIQGSYDPKEAVQKADVIYTDVWVSMGQEKSRKQKVKDFKGMQVNEALLKHASSDVKIMHCLPAHRGEEITNDVMEGKSSIVFDQAENRLHAQKAILVYLCGEE